MNDSTVATSKRIVDVSSSADELLSCCDPPFCIISIAPPPLHLLNMAIRLLQRFKGSTTIPQSCTDPFLSVPTMLVNRTTQQHLNRFTSASFGKRQLSSGVQGISKESVPTIAPGAAVPAAGVLPLNGLRDVNGARKNKRRIGRGIGCGRGKTCGRGHKGQNARAGRGPGPLFEGGQTELHLRLPRKRSVQQQAHQMKRKHMPEYVTLPMLQRARRAGKLPQTGVVHMRMLTDAGIVNLKRARRNGVYLRRATTQTQQEAHSNDGASTRKSAHCPLHLELTGYDPEAKAQLEHAGGAVESVYYNALGMRALLQPHKFDTGLPRPAWPPQRLAPKYDKVGTLGGYGPRGSELVQSQSSSNNNNNR